MRVGELEKCRLGDMEGSRNGEGSHLSSSPFLHVSTCSHLQGSEACGSEVHICPRTCSPGSPTAHIWKDLFPWRVGQVERLRVGEMEGWRGGGMETWGGGPVSPALHFSNSPLAHIPKDLQLRAATCTYAEGPGASDRQLQIPSRV